jgi:hypothetical protein
MVLLLVSCGAVTFGDLERGKAYARERLRLSEPEELRFLKRHISNPVCYFEHSQVRPLGVAVVH